MPGWGAQRLFPARERRGEARQARGCPATCRPEGLRAGRATAPPGLEPGPALPLRPAPRSPASEPRGPALCVTLPVSVQPAGPQRRWGRNGRAMARPGLQGQRWGEGWVLLCDGWWCRADSPGSLFLLLPTLPHNRLTVSGTHGSGYSAPPLAKNRRPRKLLSHPHGVRNGEETFPMPEWVASGS